MPITSHDAELVLHSIHQMVAQARTTLHNSAQPLALLQGILELAMLKNGSIDDFRITSETALREAQRVCEHFDELRKTVRACAALLNQVECVTGGTLT